jgi:alkylation response protein AidB-like acyl-CoA dehydrogenase
MADFGGDVTGFREEAREWIEANLPASLHGQADAMADAVMRGKSKDPDLELWRQRLAEKGWGAPTWPKAYGGGGLDPADAWVLAQELAKVGAPNPMAGMGTSMFGPTLLEYGTEDQKQRHIPPICRGEIRWCQGYSEPGAGSDLAALSTKCEDAGDHWVVNGQKIWTSGAQWADWCFCLVRTDTSRKHEGISFVLIDMHQPGVETRPIKLIAGSSPFCETFFTDARVEKNDMVGPLNGGWTIGKRLLQHERGGQGGGRMLGAGKPLPDLARDYIGVDSEGRIDDADLRARIANHVMDARAHTLTMQRAAAEAKGNSSPSAVTSIMKNSSTRIGQEKAELTLEIRAWAGKATPSTTTSARPCAAGSPAKPGPSSAARRRSRTTSSASASWACRMRPNPPE